MMIIMLRFHKFMVEYKKCSKFSAQNFVGLGLERYYVTLHKLKLLGYK